MKLLSASLVLAALASPLLAAALPKEQLRDDQLQDGQSPIIIIPGKGGSQLEVKVSHPDCASDWSRVWINIYDFLPFTGHVECWAQNMELQYNTSSGESHTAPGRQFRIPGWGTTESIEYIDPSWMAYLFGDVGSYAAYLVQELTNNWGYERGVNLLGAPYDFRYSPVSHEEYFDDLKRLVEQTYLRNGRRRVLLVSHSMGGLMATFFLNHQTDDWKRSHIKGLVTLNTPWDGAMVVAQLHAAGDDWGIEIVDRNIIRDQQRSYESAYFLLPHEPTWQSDDVIVRTPQRNFTVRDYEEMFDMLGHPEGKSVLRRARPAWSNIHHPGVDLYCWHGQGVDTVDAVHYSSDQWPNGIPDTHTGDGDGTVNLKSLNACSRFAEEPGSLTDVRGFDGVNHLDLLHDAGVMERLVAVARGVDLP
ncbi:hypothetical protein CAPTEDRAFT_214081 [Capitella teleta]|uniref:Lecithin:cholesterol acyltransferase n=1 Tax=Capitella teleta TaxID=283909 RepID=R7TKS4_CAPTE|nr:hypothetical protein CAPTEDRAFT_214081 [Capitella teleta]|eukprot:ELT94107.1 hypothetical protein CAPTEDRAFT_214081 [Capitella teleta]